MTVTERDHTRRPDVVLFVNGLPLGVIELKNPADEEADIWTAWQQLQTYKAELPALFSMNELLVVSDGTEARLGTLTAGREWFKPWRTVSGEGLAEVTALELRVLLEGVCAPERLLPLLRDFIVFEDDGSGVLVKKTAGYHQFHAVRTAVAETLRAARLGPDLRVREETGHYEAGQQPGGSPGDRRIGVSGTRKARARACRWPSTPARSRASRRWITRPSSSSPTRGAAIFIRAILTEPGPPRRRIG